MSSALGLTIAIIRSDKAAPNIFKQANAKKTVYLGYDVAYKHYQSLVEDSEAKTKAHKSIEDAISAAAAITNKAKTAKSEISKRHLQLCQY